MKTTLVIDDQVMRRLREEAGRQGRTISELVESALRVLLEHKPAARRVPPLPSFDLGKFRVDISDRDALDEAMEGR